MSTCSTAYAEPDISRVAPIVLGRNDYLSVVLRLVGMDLYKMYRRKLSKLVLLAGIVVVVGLFLALGITAWHMASQPATSYVPANCAVFPHNAGCINHPPTLADMRHEKQRILNGVAQFLNMPGSWNLEAQVIIQALVVLGIILAGMLVGDEYSLGTVRLMYTRGPTRLRFLTAKILVLAIFVVPTVLVLILLGMGVGGVMAHLAGIGAGLGFFTTAVFGHFVLYLLVGMLFWFSYLLMTLFFGTVGRSTVAAIVGPLIWLASETLIAGVIISLTSKSTGGLLKALPDYFLGTNLASLLQHQEYALSIADPAPYSTGHSLLVVACYLIAFVGVACWLTVRRDVIH